MEAACLALGFPHNADCPFGLLVADSLCYHGAQRHSLMTGQSCSAQLGETGTACTAAADAAVGHKLPAEEAAAQQPLLAATSSHLASMAGAGYRTLVVAGAHHSRLV